MAMGLSKKNLLMVAIIISGSFVTMLNQTVMPPMLPAIMTEYQITTPIAQWLTTIFLLVNGLMIPITAYLISRFSTRQIFLASMLIFIAGSVICAFTGGFFPLLGGRILQAIGAGVLMPFTTVIIMTLFPKERRGFALGISFVVVGTAPAFGPTLAGWITDTLGWRSVFYLILPLAVIDFVLAFLLLRNVSKSEKASLDGLSVVLSVLGFGGLLFGFSMAGARGWTHPMTWVPILVGAISLFFYGRRQFGAKEPLLNLRVLRNSVFSTSVLLTMIGQMGMTVGMIITPLFLQQAHGETALISGLTLMPAAIAMAATNPLSGMIFDKFGPRGIVIAGFAIHAVGSGLMATVGVNTPLAFIVIVYTVRMIGISFVYLSLNASAINALPNKYIAHGTAVINTGGMVAGSIGTAIMVTVMTMVSAAYPVAGPEALAHGVDVTFGVATAITLVALVISIWRIGRSAYSVTNYELD
jgi:EmrB/QacA subfamily drug resistance transporter